MSMPVITDVHLSTDGQGSTIIFPGQQPALPEHLPMVERLIAGIQQQPNCKKIVLGDESRWRVQRMREARYALRQLRDQCPPLHTLGLPKWVQQRLLSSKMRETGGLVLIFGHTGAGKTVTFGATIIARLHLMGGYALTLEDPPEDVLEGHHGKGYCEQIDVSEFGGYEKGVHAALRCFPAKDASMLGFGEVLSAEMAAQLLRLSGDGHLVFATVHAKTIAAGLERVASMAKAAGEANANELLSSSFQLAIHQRFDDSGKLCVQALPREHKVSSHIHRGEYAALTPEVESVRLSHLQDR
ncbi:ATPase, T2SS/T4P/T4SS family (plasmid) [Pseudomonas orientalis]|uniref:ATPase, T2SS/T4P/T4SS family n=1 Tax=Pseudomonas orientalis TaxID=76758 RepID=UPI0039856FD6